MQVDFSLEELKFLKECSDHRLDAMFDSSPDYVAEWGARMQDKLSPIIEELEELEGMDLDDCVGGACKL